MNKEEYQEAFDAGASVGYDIGYYNATAEAIRAHEAGEIELWLDFHHPRSVEEWEEWTREHGPIAEYSKRWRDVID